MKTFREGWTAFLIVALTGGLGPERVEARDCLDYDHYLHCSGRCDTPFIACGVAIRGDHAYVADGNRDLQIIDIGDPDAPIGCGSIAVMEGLVAAVAIDGYLYLAAGGQGLAVVALDDPVAPEVRGIFPAIAPITRLVGEGDRLLAVGGTGLLVIDISDREMPVVRGTMACPGARDLAARDDIVAIIADGLRLVDVSDPDQPLGLATLAIPDGPQGVDLQGSHAFVACGGSSSTGFLKVVDVSDPTHPAIVGSGIGSSAEDVVAVGNLVYLGGLVPSTWHGRFQVFDVADPAAPARLVATATPGQPRQVLVIGDRAFVADGGGGLQVVDIANPAPPPIASEVAVAGAAIGIAAQGRRVYVAGRNAGLQILDVSDPEQPLTLAMVPCPGVQEVATSPARVCCLDVETGELLVVDDTSSQLPFIAGRVALPGALRAVAVVGTTAYVAAGAAGLQIVDLSVPADPVVVGSIPLMERAVDIVVLGRYACVLATFSMWNEGVLHLVDVSDPASPLAVGWYFLGGATSRLETVAGHVLMVTSEMLCVIDISDPTSPVEVGGLWGFSDATDLAVAGDHAYVVSSHDGLAVVDLAEPTTPRLLQTVIRPAANRIAAGSHAVCSTSYAGVTLYWPQCADLTDALPAARPVAGLRVVPNPFNPRTRIVFDVPVAARVRLAIHDARGRLVRELVDESVVTGEHAAIWDGRDASGHDVAAGVYVCRLLAPWGAQTRKLSLIR